MRLSEDEARFFSSVKAGDVSAVKRALRPEPYLVEFQDEWQNTPLHYAVKSKSVELVRLLLSSNADVNAVDGAGSTPLHWAIEESIALHWDTESCFIEIAEALLEAGAGVNATNEAGKAPLHEAASNGRIREAQVLINYGADINIKGESSFTPLHYAAVAGAGEMVTFLATNGAEVNSRSDEGYTPLHWAVCANIWAHQIQKHVEAIEVLIQHGADVGAQTNDGKTALTVAQEENPGRPQLADLLKRYGAR
jgi:ankyrin repeat protein